ncbi:MULTISPECIES: hypothetical protein [unclassified Acidovorax]|uniref:hypothetical protein n=1 Tax=unclassified Acidovorax TaxID=2684926 RepID=UPI002882D55A|nr:MULTISPECIES: hypothetical protein [unclassified Acidovorax]
MHDQRPPDSDFDLRARAELALAFDPGQPPPQLFRHTPLLARRGFQRGLAALLLAATGTTAVLAMRPPALVRGAIEHEYYERTLRGSFMDTATLLRHLGMDSAQAVPGYPQLMRPCDIEGHLAYHLTSFFDKGGMVTVFAFDAPVLLQEDSGWWGNVYWKVMASRDGKPLVLVAQKKRALAVAHNALAPSTPVAPLTPAAAP